MRAPFWALSLVFVRPPIPLAGHWQDDGLIVLPALKWVQRRTWPIIYLEEWEGTPVAKSWQTKMIKGIHKQGYPAPLGFLKGGARKAAMLVLIGAPPYKYIVCLP